MVLLERAPQSFSNFLRSLLCRGVTVLLHFKLCWSSRPGTKPLVTPFLPPGRASDPVSQDWLSNADRAGTGWDKKTVYVQVLGQLGLKKKKKRGAGSHSSQDGLGAFAPQCESIFKCRFPKTWTGEESCWALIFYYINEPQSIYLTGKLPRLEMYTAEARSAQTRTV